MILFSIAVHEKPEVVANQVENFIFFNPGCQIVIHVSAWMGADEFAEMQAVLARYPQVHINDTRLWSGYADGTQMKMHVVNYMYALKAQIPFEYFCLHASNDMFVRPGLAAFLVDYDAGGYAGFANKANLEWVHMFRATKDRLLRKLMKALNVQHLQGGQLEGSFYRRDIMDKVMSLISDKGMAEIAGIYRHGFSRKGSAMLKNKYVSASLRILRKGMFFAKEEIYFPTLGYGLAKKKAPYNYCYVNWTDNLNVTKADVDNIRAGNFGALKYQVGLGLPISAFNFFAVKRIDRRIDDPMRVYITSLQH